MLAGVSLKGRKVAVLGANASGIALVKFLLKKGAIVKLIDMRSREIVEPIVADALDPSRYVLECGEFNDQSFVDLNQVILTPSVQADSKTLEAARLMGLEVISELEFASQFIAEPVLAIVGTNGKSTTAAFSAAILENSGKTVFTNVHQPISQYLNQPKPADVVIAVCNSIQLESVQSLKPAVVVATNFSEDYLNRYPNLDSYYGAFREVFKNVDDSTILILNAQDAVALAMAPQRITQARFFSSQAVPEGIEAAWFNKNQLFIRPQIESDAWSVSLTQMRMRGNLNKENLAAAVLATIPFGATREAVEKVVLTQSALPGRLEFVKRLNSVAFYDDSHGVNVQAVLRTLQAFTEPVILISGGRDKNQDYTPLIPHIRQRVKNLILVGEAKEKMNRAIGDYTETFLVGTVEEAVILAYQKSRSGDVILLSPGCAPSDAFASNGEKGQYYKKLVTQIAAPRRPTVF